MKSLDGLEESLKAYHERRERELEEERAANGGKLKKHDFQARACITYWHGRLLSAPVPMPATAIIRPDVDLFEFAAVLDGDRIPEAIAQKFDQLVRDVEFQCEKLGYPAFLRTGTTSGKHDWKDTCYIGGPFTSIRQHLFRLIEDAAIKDQCLDVFVVRELLPTKPAFFAFHGQMPIVRERRFFARDGRVLGDIPYWPEEAFEGQPTSIEDWRPVVAELARLEPEVHDRLTRLTESASQALDGAWSIDWLETERGWYLTDCAPAERSYGWSLLPEEARLKP